MKPHKHKDLIIAWANGAEIQYRSAVSGADWESTRSPTWTEAYEYRIKPQPKKCRVALMNWANPDSGNHEPKTYTENFFRDVEKSSCFVKWISPVIEYFEE